MPNSLAYLALLTWPLVVLVLFRRLPPSTALIWSVLGGYLALPPVANIDLPAIPPMDKFSIPVLSAYMAAWITTGQRVRLFPPDLTGRVLCLIYLVWPLVSVQSNGEPLPRVVYGDLPGLRNYDAISLTVEPFMVVMMLALSRSLLTGPGDQRQLLQAMALGGLIYSGPMVIEVVLSPQINTWVYGFFPHDFIQMMREGGFRPVVFLSHGLWVAFYAATAIMALVALTREADPASRGRMMMATLWMLVVLVLCKSLGSLIFTMFLAPMIWWLSPRALVRVALFMGVLAVSYPLVRSSPLFPLEGLVNMALSINPDRAQSLEYRLLNETVLIARAFEKPWTGWASFGRNLLYDPITGRVTSVTDGRWIIALGNYGLPGFAAEFGLMLLPLLRLVRNPVSLATATLAVMLGVNMVDLLPNATLTPLTWLVAGALLARQNPVTESAQIPPKDTLRLQKRTII